MEFKDYYAILGVLPEADAKEIKTAYRKLAKKYHPDVSSEPDAEAKFKEMAEAYEVLKDAARREEYDELRRYGGKRADGFEPPPGWQSSRGSDRFSGDFSDFFNSMFGGGNQTGGFQGQEFAFKGQDVEIEMPLFLEDTLTDISKPIHYRLPDIQNGQTTYIEKSLKVKIPTGMGDGERIRLKGQGAPGHNGGPAGDLYLYIRLVPHPLFDIEGHNLIITVPIAPWEAALGTKVIVPTLEGKINLTLKPGSQSGQRLRIKDKGLKTKSSQGDLYAVLKVVMPDKTNPELDALWKQMAEQTTFDPRTEWEK
jgi:curved DNA-binding protein